MPKLTRRVWSWVLILRKVEGEMIKAVNDCIYNINLLPDTVKEEPMNSCLLVQCEMCASCYDEQCKVWGKKDKRSWWLASLTSPIW